MAAMKNGSGTGGIPERRVFVLGAGMNGGLPDVRGYRCR